VVPPALGYEAFNKVSTPNADKELIIYNSSGHSPMSNEPIKFANDIISFVERYK
jgi:pimeloyl-ACP methyl ester carboxylesterase